VQKLVLMSVLIATFALPSVLHQRKRTVDGFRAMVPPFTAFVALYVFLLLYVYPRLH
jgi:hypothetical protein